MNAKLDPFVSLPVWRDGVEVGDRLVYHSGNLAHDCHASQNDTAATVRLREHRAAAWQLYLAGQVRLFQRRVRPDDGGDVWGTEYLIEASDDAPNADYVAVAMERPASYRKLFT